MLGTGEGVGSMWVLGTREGVGSRVVSPPWRVCGRGMRHVMQKLFDEDISICQKLLLPHNFGIEQHQSPLHDEIICMNAIVWKIYNMYSAGLIYFIQPLHYTNLKVVNLHTTHDL